MHLCHNSNQYLACRCSAVEIECLMLNNSTWYCINIPWDPKHDSWELIVNSVTMAVELYHLQFPTRLEAVYLSSHGMQFSTPSIPDHRDEGHFQAERHTPLVLWWYKELVPMMCTPVSVQGKLTTKEQMK